MHAWLLQSSVVVFIFVVVIIMDMGHYSAFHPPSIIACIGFCHQQSIAGDPGVSSLGLFSGGLFYLSFFAY
uniref:Uncharacterized protein n=1 Tax=Arundo donax TaxID=35708 RepID=A0A0A9ECH4_ARUDO